MGQPGGHQRYRSASTSPVAAWEICSFQEASLRAYSMQAHNIQVQTIAPSQHLSKVGGNAWRGIQFSLAGTMFRDANQSLGQKIRRQDTFNEFSEREHY